jgi:hypothetical protein
MSPVEKEQNLIVSSARQRYPADLAKGILRPLRVMVAKVKELLTSGRKKVSNTR